MIWFGLFMTNEWNKNVFDLKERSKEGGAIVEKVINL